MKTTVAALEQRTRTSIDEVMQEIVKDSIRRDDGATKNTNKFVNDFLKENHIVSQDKHIVKIAFIKAIKNHETGKLMLEEAKTANTDIANIDLKDFIEEWITSCLNIGITNDHAMIYDFLSENNIKFSEFNKIEKIFNEVVEERF